MRVVDVVNRVEVIRGLAADSMAAHVEEDRLYRAVLAAIGVGNPEARSLACAALAASQVEFPRRCA